METFSPTPEQLEETVKNASNQLNTDGTWPENGGKDKSGYTVFNADGSMDASFWSFNQNPKNKDQPFYEWFTKKEFRQAMSCLFSMISFIRPLHCFTASTSYSFFLKDSISPRRYFIARII